MVTQNKCTRKNPFRFPKRLNLSAADRGGGGNLSEYVRSFIFLLMPDEGCVFTQYAFLYICDWPFCRIFNFGLSILLLIFYITFHPKQESAISFCVSVHLYSFRTLGDEEGGENGQSLQRQGRGFKTDRSPLP